MAFRNVYTGGACNADGTNQMSQNPFKQFMDKMLFGQAQQQQIQQQIGVQQDQNVNNAIQQRQMQFQQMNDQWNQLSKQFDQATLEEKTRMDSIFQQEQQKYMQFMEQQQFIMENQWKEAQLQHEADQMMQEYTFNEHFENAEQLVEAEQHQSQYAEDMINVMMNDPDPKFQQSKFLGFLSQLKQGSLQIKDKQIVDKQGKVVEQPALERIANMDELWNKEKENLEKQQQNPLGTYEDHWNKRVEEYENELKDDSEFQKKLEAEYKKILASLDENNMNEMFTDAWQKASDQQEYELYKDASDVYQFQLDNPYLTTQFPLQVAIDLVNKGQNTEAILALEAHIQKHNQDANAWRILGRLHQENDSDQRAVAAFLNGIKHNQNDLDTLGALGISCTNILDEVRAMSYLKQWLIRNPAYNQMMVDNNIVPDNTSVYDFTMEQIKVMNQRMIDIFEQAFALNNKDVELMNSLAVLYFIQRSYAKSVEIFKRALQIEPNNYQIWNKLGATLAHLGEADQAMFCYHRALDLRPNFVRVWVNLAFAQSYKGEYEEAARLYLSALTINPQAKHIWGYLQTAFLQLERPDLIQKIQFYDPKAFEDDFKITKSSDLPDPDILYREANNLYIFRMPEEQWIQDFQNQPQQQQQQQQQ